MTHVLKKEERSWENWSERCNQMNTTKSLTNYPRHLLYFKNARTATTQPKNPVDYSNGVPYIKTQNAKKAKRF